MDLSDPPAGFMTRFRHILAWFLLGVLGAGGIAGPAVHRVQHAVEQAAVANQSCHPSAVHNAEGGVWTEEAVDLRVPQCDLCVRPLVVVLPVPKPSTSPQVADAPGIERRRHVASAGVFADRFIRGPPSLPYARPA